MATRDVELIIKARDQATNVANAVTAALNNLAKAETNVSATGEKTSSVLSRLQTELAGLQATANGLGGFARVATQMDRASVSVAKMEANLARAQTALGEAAAKSGTTAAKIAALQAKVDSSAAALDKQRSALAELTTAANAAGNALGGVATDQKAIQAASESTAQAIARVSAAIAQERAALSSQGATAQVGQAQAAVAAYRAQVATLGQLKAAHQAARAEANRLGAELAKTANPTQQLRTEFALAAAASKQAKTDFIAAGQAMSTLRGSAEGNLAAFTRFADAEVRAGNAARAAATGLGQAKAQSDALYQSLLKNLPATDKLASSQAKLVAQQQRLRSTNPNKAGQGANDTILGLNPLQTQNLAFQINDVVSGLASGQRPLQIFAQQAGQIGQLFKGFNNILINTLRLLPALAIFGVILSPVIVTLKQLGEENENLREFSKLLAAAGEQGQVTAAQLSDAAEGLTKYGVAAKDARAAETEFAQSGIAAEHLDALGKTAANLAPVLGVEVPEAAKKLAAAVTGNQSAIDDLDKSLGFLTDSERKQIAALDASTTAENRADNERQKRIIVEQALIRSGNEVAAKSQGPWALAFRELGRAFQDVVDALKETGIFQAAGNALDGLAEKARSAARDFRVGFEFIKNGGAFSFDPKEIAAKGRAAVEKINEADRRAASANGDALDPNSAEASRRAAERTKNQLEFNKSLQETVTATQEETKAIRLGTVEAAGQRAVNQALANARRAGVQVTEDQIKAVRESAEAQARETKAMQAGTSEAKKRANAQREFNAAIDAANAKRRNQADRVGDTQREAAIREALDNAEVQAQQRGVKLDETRRKEIEASTAALFDAQKAQENKNALLQAEIDKRQLLNQQVSVEQQVTEEAQLQSIDLTQKYGQEWAKAQTEVLKTEEAVKKFTDAQDKVRALAQQMADKIRDFKQAASDGAPQEQMRLLKEEILALQAALIAAKGDAVSLGTALGPGFEAATVSVAATKDQIGQLKTEIVTAKELNDRLAEGLADGFVNAGIELGKVIDGTQSFGDAISNIGDAFRQFAADFLIEIAKMIAKQALLNLISNAFGAKGGVGGILSGAVNGLFAHGGDKHVGQGGMRRRVDPSVFRNAPRLHTGTASVGLKSNEVPAILQEGERVISKEENKRGGSIGGGNNTKIVNAFDASDMLSAALSSPVGQKVILNFVRSNRAAFNNASQ